MQFSEYYQNRINSLDNDIEHIKRHLKDTTDPEEIQRLKALRNKLLDEKLDYQGALETQ